MMSDLSVETFKLNKGTQTNDGMFVCGVLYNDFRLKIDAKITDLINHMFICMMHVYNATPKQSKIIPKTFKKK